MSIGYVHETGDTTTGDRINPTSVLTHSGKRELARAEKGNYESFLIALIIYKAVKNLPHPKNSQERDDLTDLQRSIAQAIRNRLDDPHARFEDSIAEIAKNLSVEFPEPDDPKLVSAIENSHGTAGNSIKARDANAFSGPGISLAPKDLILGEIEMGDFKFQVSQG